MLSSFLSFSILYRWYFVLFFCPVSFDFMLLLVLVGLDIIGHVLPKILILVIQARDTLKVVFVIHIL